jgi:hypothetical protein
MKSHGGDESDRLLDTSRHSYSNYNQTNDSNDLDFYDLNEERYIKQKQYSDFEKRNIIVWSFAESVCCDTENSYLNYIIILLTFPVILFSFFITLVDYYSILLLLFIIYHYI